MSPRAGVASALVVGAMLLSCAALPGTTTAAAAPAHDPAASPNASVAEARRLADAKQFDEAARVLRGVLSHDPKDMGARSLLARVLAWDRKYDESIAEYRSLLAAHPDDAFDRAGYARVLAWSGRTEASLREFRRAIASEPSNLETRVGYARALSWAGDLPGASMEYRRILRINPSYGDAWLGYATVARWRGAATAADRFLTRAQKLGPDAAAAREERDAIDRALALSTGGGWTASRERQYLDSLPDFTIESSGPFVQARATLARAVDVSVRGAWIAQFERNSNSGVGDSTLNYDVDMTILRADASYLRAYPFQLAAGIESRSLDDRSAKVLYPLLDDDEFFGWNARAWWFAGRFTPSVAARREFLAIKSTTGPREIQAGDQTVVGADLVWQWNARGTANVGAEHGEYSDENERGTVRARAAYRLKLANPGVRADYGVAFTDFDKRSISYFTPLESVRHSAGIGFSGYSERAALDYGARYEFTALFSSNFEDIFTNTWSTYLNWTANDMFPLGIEGSYSRDNNAYETWFLGLYGAARW